MQQSEHVCLRLPRAKRFNLEQSLDGVVAAPEITPNRFFGQILPAEKDGGGNLTAKEHKDPVSVN